MENQLFARYQLPVTACDQPHSFESLASLQQVMDPHPSRPERRASRPLAVVINLFRTKAGIMTDMTKGVLIPFPARSSPPDFNTIDCLCAQTFYTMRLLCSGTFSLIFHCHFGSHGFPQAALHGPGMIVCFFQRSLSMMIGMHLIISFMTRGPWVGFL